MKIIFQKISLTTLILFSVFFANAQTDSLDNYIQRLRLSLASGGSETAYLSIGSDFLYGQDYFDAGDFSSAFYQFRSIIRKEKDHPYANYQLAVSLLKQNDAEKAKLAEIHLASAFKALPALRERYQKDFNLIANATTNKPIVKAAEIPKEKVAPNKTPVIKNPPAKPVKYGGNLAFGDYTCHVSVWKGPNVSPAYRFDYKGYFTLKKDGSYRWLDNGSTGKFSYNAATGEIKRLSGYFKDTKPKISQYQPGNKTAQITITFSDSNRWECGCDK